MTKNKIALIIDENTESAKITRDAVHSMGIVDSLKIISTPEKAKTFILLNKLLFIVIELNIKNNSTLEIIRWIRQTNNNPNLTTPIILLTSNATPDIVKASRDAGITELVLKPFTSSTLKSAIVSSIENPRDFIISRNYVGPDRRRRNIPPPDGKEKRKKDLNKEQS